MHARTHTGTHAHTHTHTNTHTHTHTHARTHTLLCRSLHAQGSPRSASSYKGTFSMSPNDLSSIVHLSLPWSFPTPLLTLTTASLSFIHPTLTLPGTTISTSPSSFRDTSTTLACFFYKEPNTHNANKPSHTGTELKLYYKMTEGLNMPARLTAPVSCINTIERPTFRTTQIVIQAVTFSTIVTVLYQQHKHRLLGVCDVCACACSCAHCIPVPLSSGSCLLLPQQLC